MIEINNLSFQYNLDNNVLDNINLNIKKNEKVTIIGKSGCGKTTLLYLLACILKPSKGNILINKKPLNQMRSRTGVIFQNGGLLPWKSVYDNLALGLKSNKYSKTQINEKVVQVLNELDILDIKDKYIKNISGGQKQRVAIGRVLALDLDILLLDEPSSALDAMTKENYQKTMLDLYRNHSVTSIIVTHDIEEAVYLGEKILIMNNGKIKNIIINDLYGNYNAKNTIEFYKKCINIREMLL